MRLLRNDLVIAPSKEAGSASCLVQDPRSGEIFKFGEAEYFLLQALTEPYDTSEVINEFNAEFNVESTVEEFNAFLDILTQWGLLQDSTSDSTLVHLAKPTSRPSKSTLSRSSFLSNVTAERAATLVTEADKSQITAEDISPDKSKTSVTSSSEYDHIEDSEYSEDSIVEEIMKSQGRVFPLESSRIIAEEPGLSSPSKQKRFNHWRLFHPQKLFDRLSAWFYPLRWFVYLLPVLCVIALAALWNNFHLLSPDLFYVKTIPFFQHLLFTFVTINLITQIAKGVVCRNYGVETPSFGVKLVFGLIPRFDTITGNLVQLPKGPRLWVQSSPILTRLTLLSFGIIAWIMTRPTGTEFSTFCLMLSTFSLFGLIIVANPLFPGSGYQVLTTLLDTPNLRQKANRALFSHFSKNKRAAAQEDEESQFALKIYALASLIFIVLLLGFIAFILARWLELNYQGTGVIIFLALFTYLVLYFRRQIRMRKAERQAKLNVAKGIRMADRPRAQPRLRAVEREFTRQAKLPADEFKPPAKKTPWLSYALLAIVIACLFLPYPYETGGPAEILPIKQHEIYAETPGIVEQVLYKGGEWIEQGAVIAKLSSHAQKKDYFTTQAEINEQQATLEKLLTTPTKEALTLAQKQLETARVQARYSAERAKRLEQLYSSGTVSLEEYEDARRKMEVDRMQVIEEEANLALVENSVHPKEIEAARAELEQLQEQLKFHEEQLNRTNLTMPIDGRITTTNLQLLTGKYLDKGDLFAVVQNDQQVRVEFLVPQADIGEITLGDRTRLKIWAYPNKLFYGEVSEIAPSVTEEEEQGKVVRVVSIFDNENGLLKSGTTGFGKIEGETKPVIVAFTRLIVRFALIEMWSWLP